MGYVLFLSMIDCLELLPCVRLDTATCRKKTASEHARWASCQTKRYYSSSSFSSVQLEDKAGRSCFAHCNAVLSKSFHSLSSITFLLVMFASHRPRVFRSRLGCCICGAKSSSSRFTSSSKYEVLFSGCFQLNEKRQGEICNACVLLVKRWKKLPPGSSKNWTHVSLSKTFVFFPVL